MEFKKKTAKSNEHEIANPMEHIRHAGHSRFKRFSVAVASLFTFAGGTNLNPLWQNIAMAQPKPAQKDAPKEVTKEVPPEVSNVELIKRAETAVEALRAFILTGDSAKKDTFMTLWNAHNSNDVFYNKLIDNIVSNPANRSLFKSVQDGLLKGPAVTDKDSGVEFPVLVAAVQAYYDNMAKPEAERDNVKLVDTYGAEFVNAMGSARKRTSVPVRASEEQAYNYFVKIFDLTDIKATDNLQTKANAVMAAVKDWFNVKNDASASALTRALVIAYSTLDDEDDKKMFGRWLNDMKEPNKKALSAQVDAFTSARGLTLPYELVLTQFKAYKAEREAQADKAQVDEAALKRYPLFIRETTLSKLGTGFESNPTDFGLDDMGLRLEYLRKRRLVMEKSDSKDAKQQIAAIDAEISAFSAWLAKLSIKTDKPEEGLAKLRSGLIYVQTQYYTMEPGKPGIIDYLATIQGNNFALYTIFKTYLLDLDSRVIGAFKGMSAQDPNFIATATRNIEQRLNAKRIKQAQYIWQNDYFTKLAPTGSAAQPGAAGTTPRSWIESQQQQVYVDPQLLNYVSTLDPMMAAAFLDYQEIAQHNGLTSNTEHKLVVATIAKLYAVSPLLVPKYLAAITNLAKVCEDNSPAYEAALAVLAARLDAVTASVLDPTSPSRMLPLNYRKTILGISDAFEDIMKISAQDLSRYDRLNLMDDRLKLNVNPPHDITQTAPGYAPRMLVDPRSTNVAYPPYPFPNYMMSPTPNQLFNFGGVVNSPAAYTGSVTLPTFQPLKLTSGAGMVGASTMSYFYPQHSVVTVSPFLPNVNISPLSPTRLLNDINRAFVPKRQLDYSSTPIGGGGGLGLKASKPGDSWEYAGGGLASLITPTGGAALGGAVQGQELFAGATAVAMPIGKVSYIPRTTPVVGPVTEGEIGIDSAIGGLQKSLDSSASKLLIRAISSQWDPNNPSQLLIAVNRDETVDGKTFMTARYYFVDRDGTIFEIKGGQNDFVRTLNYVAGYANQQFNTPTTYAWNEEHTVKRGGGAIVVDIGKTALLAHAQAIPFMLAEDQPMPFLLQWTGGIAHTWDGTEAGKATIGQIALPGKMLILQQPATTTGETPKEDKYILQDLDMMLRRVRGKDAYEIRVGGGLGTTPTGMTGRAGVFIKFAKPEYERAGGGLYYEGGSTNMEALALLQSSQDAQKYIQSLHRLAATGYYSTMNADRLIMATLMHVMPQWTSTQTEGTKFDNVFWRWVGVLKAMGVNTPSDWGVRVDVTRISGLDQMMTDYEQLQANVGSDPANASTYIKNFQDKYTQTFKEVMDKYNLTVQVRKDFSVDATLTAREREQSWLKQVPDTAYARLLYTWDGGFTRAFAMMPIQSSLASVDPTKPVPRVGIVGAGVGVDLFDSVFLPRAVMDVGALLARYETDNPQDITAWEPYGKLPKSGWFVQGGVVVFSNVAEDSQRYRRLVASYERYASMINNNKFHMLPEDVRKEILQTVDQDRFETGTLDALKRGEEVKLAANANNELLNALWTGWYSDRKTDIQKEFDGHMRAFLSGSGYFFGDRTYWDIGTYVEYVDRCKAYVIVSGRDNINVYAGGDYIKGKVRVSAMLGAGQATVLGAYGQPPSKQASFAGAASVGYRFGPDVFPMEVGLYGYGRTASVPDYAAPYYMTPQRTGIPEVGALLYLNLLGGGPPMAPMAPYAQPGPSSFGR